VSDVTAAVRLFARTFVTRCVRFESQLWGVGGMLTPPGECSTLLSGMRLGSSGTIRL
jgi:hypothetical protein